MTRKLTGEGFPACLDCGQTARRGEDYCGTCESRRDEEERREWELENCTTVEDLRDFIKQHLLD